MTDRVEGVLFTLPDGSSSVGVSKDTVRRSALLQEAMHEENIVSRLSISLPWGLLQDWL